MLCILLIGQHGVAVTFVAPPGGDLANIGQHLTVSFYVFMFLFPCLILKKHIKEHHEEVKERPCPHPGCNKVFMIDRYLQRHVKLIHTGELNTFWPFLGCLSRLFCSS